MAEQIIAIDPELDEADENVSLFTEFVWFLRENKKWWLIPLIVMVGLLGLFAMLTVNYSALSLFIYSLV